MNCSQSASNQPCHGKMTCWSELKRCILRSWIFVEIDLQVITDCNGLQFWYFVKVKIIHPVEKLPCLYKYKNHFKHNFSKCQFHSCQLISTQENAFLYKVRLKIRFQHTSYSKVKRHKWIVKYKCESSVSVSLILLKIFTNLSSHQGPLECTHLFQIYATQCQHSNYVYAKKRSHGISNSKNPSTNYQNELKTAVMFLTANNYWSCISY